MKHILIIIFTCIVVRTNAQTHDVYYREVWDIYTDFVNTAPTRSVESHINSFEYASSDELATDLASEGRPITQEANNKLIGYKTRISELNIPSYLTNSLASVFMEYLLATQRWVNSWGTVFSCYSKNDMECFEGEKADLSGYTYELNKLTRELETTVQTYKERNGL